MSATHVTAVAAWDGERLRLADPTVFSAGMRKMKPAEGEPFVVRVEREADAKRHHQLKWFYGYIVKQCVEKTGYTVVEMDTMFRSLFMPHDVPTLSLMSYEQMQEFNRACEQYAAETIGIVIAGPHDARNWEG